MAKLTRVQLISEVEALRTQLRTMQQRVESLVDVNNRQETELKALRSRTAPARVSNEVPLWMRELFFAENPDVRSATREDIINWTRRAH